jgi:hypothetical protein
MGTSENLKGELKMGEQARRMAAGGPKFKQMQPGQQIQVDLKNAVRCLPCRLW